MLPLVDKPLIQYTIEEAKAAGINDVILITGTGKSAIEDHFDTSFALEVLLRERGKHETLRTIQEISELINFTYTRQKRPLGLGHAIYCARNLVGDEPFAVVLGDDIIDAKVPALKQMVGVFKRYPWSMIAVQKVPKNKAHLYGIVKAKKVEPGIYRVLDLVEKPEVPPSNLAIIGRYILTPRIFNALEKTEPDRGGEIQLTNALKILLGEEPVYAYEFEGERYDAGDKVGFLKANIAMALKRPEMRRELKRFIKGLKL